MGRASQEPPPPICNRVGVAWGTEPLPCHCDQWWPWLEKHTGPGQAAQLLDEVATNWDEEKVKATPQPLVSYWRPGGRNMRERYFYNGVVLGAWKVLFPGGHRVDIVGVS